MNNKRSFKAKLTIMVLISVISISIIVILLTSIVSGNFIIKNAKKLAFNQEEIICNAITQELWSLYQVGKIMSSDIVLKEDVEIPKEEEKNYIVFSNEVYGKLLDFKKLNPNIEYITFLKYRDESIKYVGYHWSADKKEIYNSFYSDYQKANSTEYNEMKASVSKEGFKEGYYLNLYFPVYDSKKVYKEIGLICIGIPESVIGEYYQTAFFDSAYIIDKYHIIVSSQKKSEIGKQAIEEAYFSKKGSYRFQKEIGISNWIFKAEISMYKLLQDWIGIFFLSMGLVCCICVVVIMFCFRMTKKMLHPLEDLQTRMRSLSEGNMESRMERAYKEDEFNEMAKSFNTMVVKVDELMNDIKEEQMQMKQIELNALQSQIKPHFLYNTLECIHMQAVIDKNKDIVKLVKALANYYRLCLNKGQDIVSLRQELEHIENYLIIQNMRYSNMISCDIVVEKEYLDIKIPKMTLQPLIENAIYHGIKIKEKKKGNITIQMKQKGDDFVLLVKDNGAGMSQVKVVEINNTIHIFDEQYGYGVRNVNKRLQIIFGIQYGLQYCLNEQGGVTVEIYLPGKGSVKVETE